MDDETKTYLDAMMVQINNQFDRILDNLSAVRADTDNTKGHVLIWASRKPDAQPADNQDRRRNPPPRRIMAVASGPGQDRGREHPHIGSWPGLAQPRHDSPCLTTSRLTLPSNTL